MKSSEGFHLSGKIALPTISHIPDDLWLQIQPLLPQKASGSLGRPRLCYRRDFYRWSHERIFEMIWVLMLECYDDRVGIAWD